MIEKLAANNGKALQIEIGRMGEMNKLKAHRTASELEKKSVVRREAHGKTYKVILQEDVKSLF